MYICDYGGLEIDDNAEQLLDSNNVTKTNMALCGLQLFWPHSLKLF